MAHICTFGQAVSVDGIQVSQHISKETLQVSCLKGDVCVFKKGSDVFNL